MRGLIRFLIGFAIFFVGLVWQLTGKMRLRVNLAIMAFGLLVMLNRKKKKEEDEITL